MKPSIQQHGLAPLVVKAQKDPFFLGWAINCYANSYNMKTNNISAFLKCDENSLDKLSLCRLPDDTSAQFMDDVKQISDYAKCDSNALVVIIREVNVINKFKENSSYDKEGFLMAARDRNKEDDNEDEQDPK